MWIANWQTIVSLAIVGIAIAYLVRRAWCTFAAKNVAGCGSCDHQGVMGIRQKQLVTLDALISNPNNKDSTGSSP